MRRLIALLCCAAIAANVRATVAEAVKVPLEIRDGGYLFVRCNIAGVDARLLLDTGAGINTLSKELRQRLGKEMKPAGKHTGTRHNGEQITGPVWQLSALTLGNYTRRHVIVGEFAPASADGLLSMDYFRDQPFTLDFRRGELTLEPPERVREIARTAQAIPIRLHVAGPQVEIFVRLCFGQNVEAEAEFDTGAGFNLLMLHPSYLARLGIKKSTAPRGPLEYYVHTTKIDFHYCSAPALSAQQHFVGFKEGLIYDGLVGSGMFRGRCLTIDLPGQRMLVWD